MRTLTYGVLSVLLALGLSACQQGTPEPAEEVINRVENAELGVAIADLPDVFQVARNEGTELELELVEGTGYLQVVAGEPESSINLVAALEAHQADILGRPGAGAGSRGRSDRPRYLDQAALAMLLSSARMSCRAFLASEKSIIVLSRSKSSFLIPAKPGDRLRLIMITVCAS